MYCVDQNIQSLGFQFSDELLIALQCLEWSEFKQVYNKLIQSLRILVVAHVEYRSMYAGFPEQVKNLSYDQLKFNAFLHYFGDLVGARILPSQSEYSRPKLKQNRPY